MKKVLSIIMAIVMLTVIMPINTFAANLETDKYISGITYEDASEDCYGGYRVKRASDPTGIYAATYGYINDNDSVWYYFVRHYVYVDKYDAYFADENFGEYGTVLIGFPIWYGCAPNVVNTFCKGYDWTGKRVAAFATSGGSGIGKTAEKLRPFVPGADLLGAKLVRSGAETAAWAKELPGLE